MALVLLFIVLLTLCFTVLIYLLKPTAMEKAVTSHLSEIETRLDQPANNTILRDDALRSNTIVDGLVGRLPWAPAIERLVKQSGNDWRANNVFLLSVFAAVPVGLLASVIFNTLIGAVIGVAAGAAPYVYLSVLVNTRRRRFGDLLPEAVDLMSRGLRAGHSISAVLEMVGT